MGEELARILLLELYQARVEVRDPLGDPDERGVLNFVAALVHAADVQVEVGVDAIELELVDEIVQAIELLGIHRAGVIARTVDEAGGPLRFTPYGPPLRSGCSLPWWRAGIARSTPATGAGSLPVRKVQELEADAVHSEARERRGIDLGVVVRRQQRGALGPAGEIDTPKTEARAIGRGKMSAGDADEAMLACRSIEKEAHVAGRVVEAK